MNAKNLAHSIQASLRTAASLDVKRSHIHELIAAAFGHGSQAAMLATGIPCSMPQPLANCQELDGLAASRRAVALGYPVNAAAQVGPLVVAAIEQAGLCLLSLDLVLSLLLEGQTELHDWHLVPEEPRSDNETSFDEELELEYLDDEAWHAGQRDQETAFVNLMDDEVVSALALAAERSDGRAHLALALLCMGGEDGDGDGFDQSSSTDGRYWHEREQSGHVLTGVEKEWSDTYRQRIERQSLAKFHLETAAELRQPDALLLMARQTQDPRFFELQAPQVHAHPILVARVAENMGYREEATFWLTKAAESGHMDAMRELIEDQHSNNPLMCWTWYHLAKLHGKDLTRDDYRAINEDGSSYDDDVGGPMFAAGEDGVVLPDASASVQLAAEARAQEIFSRQS